MATITKITGTGTNDAVDGDTAWANPGNITADDASVANVVITGSNTSQWLLAANFDMSTLPDRSWVRGIKDTYTWKSSIDVVSQLSIKQFKGAAFTGDDKSTGSVIPSVEAAAAFGGAADLWGLTWTPTEIKTTANGVGLRVDTSTDAAQVDFVERELTFIAQPIIRSPRLLNGLGGTFFANPLG